MKHTKKALFQIIMVHYNDLGITCFLFPCFIFNLYRI